jgi:hypothetical protein
MSAIAGICYWDGRPIGESQLAALASHLRDAGPDQSGTATPLPGLAMQSHVLHFDRLSAQERQPFVFAQGSVLTWDGRLDNRDDLAVTLHRELGSDVTDAALVAAAYARWGLDCVPRLIGDWSLAIWDAPNRRLVLARDYMGNRPLYFLELPGGLAWASGLDALTEAFDLYSQPDEAYIAGRLTFGMPPDMTPFVGVRALRSGHLLQATQAAGTVIRRYWTFQPSTIRYRDPREYTDHLRVLLTDAVRVRLRARRRVWSHLSGGWDSSSVVCLAHALIQGGQVEAPALQPISGVVSGSPESDESHFITAVERWCGLRTVRCEVSGRRTIFQELLGYRRPLHYLEDDPLENHMQRAGDHIMLTGHLGDAVMMRDSSQVVSLLEPLHEGHPIHFLQLCLARARHKQRPLFASLIRLAIAGYLPAHLKSAWRTKRHYAKRAKANKISAHDLAGVIGVTTKALALAPQRDPRTDPSLAAFSLVKRPLLVNLYGWTNHPIFTDSDLTPKTWMTCPYAHRPLVDFMIGVPQLAIWDPLFSTAGLQRALAGILPPEILSRDSKGDPTAALARIARERVDELAEKGTPGQPAADWHIVRRGYVQERALTHELDTLAKLIPPDRDFLFQCLYLEAWLRTIELLARKPALARTPAPSAHAGGPTDSRSVGLLSQTAAPS